MPKRKASPAQLRALARGRGIRKAKLKRESTTKKKAAPKRKARRRNPLDPALMRVRALRSDLKAGKAPVRRKINSVYRGYVVATFAPRSQRVIFFDGKSWGPHNAAVVFGLKDTAIWAAKRYGKPAVVTGVNTAAADIRLKLLGE